MYLLFCTFSVKKILKKFNPDVVVGFGGYVSGPVVRTAAKMGIPTAIHEQNAYPGVTNKALAEKVDAVMLTVEAAKNLFQNIYFSNGTVINCSDGTYTIS